MVPMTTHQNETASVPTPAILPSMSGGEQPLTMSSREIAELLGNRHDDVKRSIDRLADRGVISLPPMAEVKIRRERRAETVSVYLLDKRSSLIVVAQLSPEFTARVVDRWQELEEQLHNAAPALPNFTDPAAAAVAWAEEYREKEAARKALASAQEHLTITGPKAEAYDRFLDSDGLRNVTDVARMIQMKPKDLFHALEKRRAIFKDGSKWKPTAAFARRGHAKLVPAAGKNGQFYDQLYLTPSGVEWAVKTFGPQFD